VTRPEPARTEFRLSGARSTRDLIAFAVIAAGVFGWYWLDEGMDRSELLMTAGGVLIFLALWNWRAARLRALAAVDRAPRLSIGDDGVLMPETFDERVPWEAITKVRVWSTRSGAFVSFRIVDPARFGFRPGLIMRLEHLVGLGVILGLGRLDADVDAVDDALRRHAPAHLTRNP
jgi:hypothetical protein